MRIVADTDPKVKERKERFQTGEKKADKPSKEDKKKEALDRQLNNYFIKNGSTEAVKNHLDKDLDSFMSKAKKDNGSEQN